MRTLVANASALAANATAAAWAAIGAASLLGSADLGHSFCGARSSYGPYYPVGRTEPAVAPIGVAMSAGRRASTIGWDPDNGLTWDSRAGRYRPGSPPPPPSPPAHPMCAECHCVTPCPLGARAVELAAMAALGRLGL